MSNFNLYNCSLGFSPKPNLHFTLYVNFATVNAIRCKKEI